MSEIETMNYCIDSYIDEINDLTDALKTLELRYNLLSKQYDKLYERYQDVLNKAKQSADSFEYCLKDTE